MMSRRNRITAESPAFGYIRVMTQWRHVSKRDSNRKAKLETKFRKFPFTLANPRARNPEYQTFLCGPIMICGEAVSSGTSTLFVLVARVRES